jgi:hypothetical protein
MIVLACGGSAAAKLPMRIKRTIRCPMPWTLVPACEKLCKIPKRKYEQQQHLILRMSPSARLWSGSPQNRPPQDGDDEAVAGPRVGGGTLGQA